MLQGILGEESEFNHVDLFNALIHMWTLARPDGPPLETVLWHVAKDFAPGIEAGRRQVLPCARPFNDFFHFMGKSTEMAARCKVLGQLAGGKFYKVNWDYAQSGLHIMHHVPTADMVTLLWPALLRRLCAMTETSLALYLFQYYTQVLTVAELNAMHVFTQSIDDDAIMFFLAWWAGFGIFPGFNCGSQTSEALHSPWERHLRKVGKNMEVEEAMTYMQQLYTETWTKQYGWDTDTTLDNFPKGDDPSLLNGVFLKLWIEVPLSISGR